ncbi:MAG: CPBP family intramembrane glutamic endopeptidase [Acidobacteriota bacterium]
MPHSEAPPPQRLLPFFGLAYGITFGAHGLYLARGHLPFEPSIALQTTFILIGYYGPLLAATLLTANDLGPPGLKKLYRSLFRWRVPPWTYAAALLPLPLAFLGAGLLELVAGPTAGFGFQGWGRLAGAFVFVLLIVPCEEIGWRGYALPGLLDRYRPLTAALILGALWGPWHLTLFLAEPWRLMGQPLILWTVGFCLFTLTLSVVMTWLALRTGGSVLMACIFHAALNGGSAAMVDFKLEGLDQPFAIPIAVAVYGTWAGVLIVRGGADLGGASTSVARAAPRGPDGAG